MKPAALVLALVALGCDSGSAVAHDASPRPDAADAGADAAADAGLPRTDTFVLPVDGWPDRDPHFFADLFYRDHPDDFDALIFLVDVPTIYLSAYAEPLGNDVAGLGRPVGPVRGRVANLVLMGGVRTLDAPNFHEPPHDAAWIESLLPTLTEEVAHRWALYLRVDRPDVPASFLRGDLTAYWSFFCDTGGSFLDGNAIADNGDGTFTTGEPRTRLNDVDLYLLGLLPPEQVAPFFCVANGHDFVRPGDPTFPGMTPETWWPGEPGVTFAGDRVDVTIDDIVAANGPRVPSSAEESHCWKVAFVLVVAGDGSYDPTSLDLVERIRVRWESFFSAQTRGLGRVDTRATPDVACGAP